MLTAQPAGAFLSHFGLEMSELSKLSRDFEEEAVVVSTIGFTEMIKNYDEVLEYFIKPNVFLSQPNKTILTI